MARTTGWLARAAEPPATRPEALVRGDGYRADIDGMRAIAVLAVMLYHAGLGVPGGFIGVDVFFVISGYLITSIIRRETATGSFSFARFYERRARRILPALFVVTAVTLAAGMLMLDPAGLKGAGGATVATMAMAANMYFWRSSGGYFAVGIDKLPLIHFWSLGVEEQFYLFWPLALVVAVRWRRAALPVIAALGFAVSLALAEYASRAAPVANFFLLPTRMWELLGGALITLVPPHVAMLPQPVREAGAGAGLAMVVAAIALFDDTTRLPGLLTLLPVAGTMLLLGLAAGTTTSRLLGAKPAAGLGLISYSGYLWHQPLLALYDAYSFSYRTPATSSAILLAALGLAAATWRYVETPFRDRRRVSRRAAIATLVGSAATLAAAGAALWLSHGWRQRLSPDGQRLATMKAAYADPMQDCFFTPTSPLRLDTACREGKGPPSMAVLGDSHALALRPAFRDIAHRSGGTVVFFTAAGCPPVFDGGPLSELQQNCAPLFNDVRRWLRRHPGVSSVVLAARWPYYLSRTWADNERGGRETGFVEAATSPARTAATARAYAAAVRTLLGDGLRVVLVYPVPEAGWDVPAYLVKAELRGLPRPDVAVAHDWFRRRTAASYAALDAVGSHPRLFRVYPEAAFCSAAECRFTAGGQPLLFDANHPDAAGARLALSRFDWTPLALPLVGPARAK